MDGRLFSLVYQNYLKVFDATQNILASYREKHYHNVKVDTVITRSEARNNADLTIIITENKKTKVKEINIDGNEAFSDWSLLFKQIKSINEYKWYLPFRGKFDEDKFNEDKNRLNAFYKKKGFRDFYIVEESVDLTEKKNGLVINIEIYEGPKYYHR